MSQKVQHTHGHVAPAGRTELTSKGHNRRIAFQRDQGEVKGNFETGIIKAGEYECIALFKTVNTACPMLKFPKFW